MAQIGYPGIAKSDRVMIAALVRAAGYGLLSAAEAGSLIDQMRAHQTTASSSARAGRPPGPNGHSGHSGHGQTSPSVRPDRTVR